MTDRAETKLSPFPPSVGRAKDPTAELVATLEACAEGLIGVQRDAERGLSLLNQALRSIADHGFSRPSGGDLEALLDDHHRRLAETISAALQSSRPATAQRFDLQIDTEARTARIGRRRVPLSESEFKVVECLWQNRPGPVSRRMLLDHLYRGKEEPSEAAIDMYIFHIRQKLKSAGCVDAGIESIKGQGWALRTSETQVAGAFEDVP